MDAPEQSPQFSVCSRPQTVSCPQAPPVSIFPRRKGTEQSPSNTGQQAAGREPASIHETGGAGPLVTEAQPRGLLATTGGRTDAGNSDITGSSQIPRGSSLLPGTRGTAELLCPVRGPRALTVLQLTPWLPLQERASLSTRSSLVLQVRVEHQPGAGHLGKSQNQQGNEPSFSTRAQGPMRKLTPIRPVSLRDQECPVWTKPGTKGTQGPQTPPGGVPWTGFCCRGNSLFPPALVLVIV